MKLAPKIGFLLNPSMPGKLKTGVIMALIILVVTCFVGYYSFQKTIDNVQLVKHTYQVKLKVEELNSAMKDVNRALSGILLRTDLVKHNDFSFYTMYREAKQNVLSKYNDVKAVTLDNTRQQKLLVTLFSIIDTRFK
jgi:CHASE3 domain sensor protein